MPIIEISEIIHRKGLRDDLPQQLNEAEIGLTLDTGEVFIGTPNFDPAKDRRERDEFPYGNTQILTEWSDNIENLLSYVYRQRPVNIDVTNETPWKVNSNPGSWFAPFLNLSDQKVQVVRHLQEKLDETVSVLDYGAINTDSTDKAAMEAQRRAFMNAITHTVRDFQNDVPNFGNKALRVPSGTYRINEGLILPSKSVIHGDGIGKTVIILNKYADIAPNQVISLDPAPSMIDGVGPGDNIQNPVVVLLRNQDDDHENGVYNYYIEDSAAKLTRRATEYMIQTAEYNPSYLEPWEGIDEDHATLYNILNAPNSIYVKGITFILKSDIPSLDILGLFRCKDVYFEDCEFIGNFTNTTKSVDDPYNGHQDNMAVKIDGLNAEPPKNINFINCKFSRTTYLSYITSESKEISFINCTLDNLFEGIILNGEVINDTHMTAGLGPNSVKLIQSNVDNVVGHAFRVFANNDSYSRAGNVSFNQSGMNLSAFNRYRNVGVNSNNYVPVVKFETGTRYNMSMGDMFDRDEYPIVVTNDRVGYNKSDSNIVINPQDPIYLGETLSSYFTAELDTGGTTTIPLPFPTSQTSLKINYTVTSEFTEDQQVGSILLSSFHGDTWNHNFSASTPLPMLDIMSVTGSGSELTLTYDPIPYTMIITLIVESWNDS